MHVLRSSRAFLVGSDSRFGQVPSWIRLRVFCVSKRTVGVGADQKLRRGYEMHVLRSSWAFLVGSDSRFGQVPSWIRLRVFCVSKRTVGVAEPIKNVWLEAVCEIRELHIFIETSYSSWNSILKLHSWNCIYCSWNCIAEIAYWNCIAGTAYCFTWYVFVYLVCMELLWYYFLLPETKEYLELSTLNCQQGRKTVENWRHLK